MTTLKTFGSCAMLGALVSMMSLGTMPAFAQEGDALVVEEVVVTAQRREQALQEVPISIEAISGAEINQQGFRNLNDLANFSPSVLIEPRLQEQDISIRGFGTTGNSLTLEQAAPTFLDGIHFGRSSQIKLAFMDVERVEILKGPQPVFFGQNATAGAFNIQSRMPTPEWEGVLDSEVGGDSTQEVNFGIGGPLTDRLGIRLAGKYETSDGAMKNAVTGADVADYESTGGRVILRWEPTEQLTVTAKLESVRIRAGTEGVSMCLTGDNLLYRRDDPSRPEPLGNERSVWDGPPLGSADPAFGTDIFDNLLSSSTGCFDDDLAVSGQPYFDVPGNIHEENTDDGAIDIKEAALAFVLSDGRNDGIEQAEDLDSVNAYVDLAYELDNGIVLNWLTGFSNFDRDYVRENSRSPFFMNYQGRSEDFEQVSTEFRVTSLTGGAIEWMVGAFWQDTELFAHSSSLRANVRRGQRYNTITEDVTWKSVFGTVTFNFADDRWSADIGGRYADIDKFATASGYGATWVYDIEPVSAGVGGPIGCTDDATPGLCDYAAVDSATARIFLPVTGAGLWTFPYRQERDTPAEWTGTANARAVGLTFANFAIRQARGEGPYAESFPDTEFDPQFTLRYRPTDNLSYFFRYAQSSKNGGFDTGQTSIPRDLEELVFEAEHVDTTEVGVKGSFAAGRVRFDVTLFNTEFDDLQISSLSVDPDQGSASLNASQRVRGLEFGIQFAASERWRLGLAGAFMDGVMTDYPNAGCTDAELLVAATGPCLTTAEAIANSPSGADDLEFTIDRTGEDAPRTPDWKFVLSASYRAPISDQYELTFDARGYISDGYLTDVEGFEEIVSYDQHEDLNLSVGFGDQAGRWRVSVFARNLLEARPTYHREFDVSPQGYQITELSPSSFTEYGAKFQYFWN